jgi:hypothetical protein
MLEFASLAGEYINPGVCASGQKAEGRKQQAQSRRQKAEGRRQKDFPFSIYHFPFVISQCSPRHFTAVPNDK